MKSSNANDIGNYNFELEFRGKYLASEISLSAYTVEVTIEAKELPKLSPEPEISDFSIAVGEELMIDLGKTTDVDVYMDVFFGKATKFVTKGT